MAYRKVNSKRRKAIIRRRIFLGLCAAVLALFILMIYGIVSLFSDDTSKTPVKTPTQSKASASASASAPKITFSEERQEVTAGGAVLDANYTRLLLVNRENPLPEDYDYEGNLVKIPQRYLSGGNNLFDKSAWKYLEAMLIAAREDGINLTVWSPFRSYADQKMVFENNVKDLVKGNGMDKKEAEKEVEKTVMHPGTSEHHTGLCADICKADKSFTGSKEHIWLQTHAAEFGFVCRYPEDKEDITKISYESWHWRFVGINRAKEMKEKNLCLEEYTALAEVDNIRESQKK